MLYSLKGSHLALLAMMMTMRTWKNDCAKVKSSAAVMISCCISGNQIMIIIGH